MPFVLGILLLGCMSVFAYMHFSDPDKKKLAELQTQETNIIDQKRDLKRMNTEKLQLVEKELMIVSGNNVEIARLDKEQQELKKQMEAYENDGVLVNEDTSFTKFRNELKLQHKKLGEKITTKK